MKTCYTCKENKPLTDFYANECMKDGRINKCKECAKNSSRENYSANRTAKRAYDRRRDKTPERRAKKYEYGRVSREKYPEKYLAYSRVFEAVKRGTLVRTPCIHCRAEGVEAHHDDYSRPLDVKWVCGRCHREKEHGLG